MCRLIARIINIPVFGRIEKRDAFSITLEHEQSRRDWG